MNRDGDAVLWISLALIAIVLTHQYSRVVKGMLFEPDFWSGQLEAPRTGFLPWPIAGGPVPGSPPRTPAPTVPTPSAPVSPAPGVSGSW